MNKQVNYWAYMSPMKLTLKCSRGVLFTRISVRAYKSFGERPLFQIRNHGVRLADTERSAGSINQTS